MSTSLAHLTLTSGHLRQSPRSEVGDDILDMLRPIVDAGGGSLHGLVVTIEERTPTRATYTLRWEWRDAPAVRCVLLMSDDSGATWQEACTEAKRLGVAVGVREPAAPWLAVMLLPGGALASTIGELAMLGDAERCVAWAMSEGQQRNALLPAPPVVMPLDACHCPDCETGNRDTCDCRLVTLWERDMIEGGEVCREYQEDWCELHKVPAPAPTWKGENE